jgi:phosphotransferase system HPr (HPr) family protein
MKSQKVTVHNKTGLHARPASVFVQTASKFKSDLMIQRDEKKASAKSIMGVLTLGISKGTEITITAEGSDEEEAVKTLVELIQSKFGEE